MKKTIAVLSLLTLCMAGMPVSASMQLPVSEAALENGQAPEHSPVIFGDTNRWGIERVDFIHRVKPDTTGKPDNNVKPDKTDKLSQCYDLLGTKWSSLPLDLILNPSNYNGSSDVDVATELYKSAKTWDDVSETKLFADNLTVDYTAEASAVYGVLDGKNVIAFGDFEEAQVIGVTSIYWNTITKEIIEIDMLMDTDWLWGDAELEDRSVMDLQNIFTHELGHVLGLGDLYKKPCSSVTMYGYSGYNDISKRTLEPADIAGLNAIY